MLAKRPVTSDHVPPDFRSSHSASFSAARPPPGWPPTTKTPSSPRSLSYTYAAHAPNRRAGMMPPVCSSRTFHFVPAGEAVQTPSCEAASDSVLYVPCPKTARPRCESTTAHSRVNRPA